MKPPILIDIPECLTAPRTLVRPYRAGDGVGMFEAVDESREHILPWMPWGPGHQTAEDSEKLVRTFRARWELREDLPVGIFERESGRYLGGSGLHRIDWEVRSFEIGYWIRKSGAGKGHVTETVQLLSKLAFEALDANRVFIRCAAANEKSAAVARRAGFFYEGRLRNGIKDARGVLHDTLMFSLIPEDWERAAPRGLRLEL
ncbi:MAG: GNAT family protein [Fimbriimonas sp.]|nr:GNAT family protein [Fimbriimonas sp.]